MTISEQDVARLFGRLMAHEFLLEQIFAERLLREPAPAAAARQWAAELRTYAESWQGGPGNDPDMSYAIGITCAEDLSHFAEKVLDRVRNPYPRRPG